MTASPAAPTTEPKGVFDIFVDERTKGDIDMSVPCDFGPELFDGDKCDEAASWIVFCKRVCSHGGMLRPPFIIMLCDKHKKWLLGLMHKGSSWRCMGCHCELREASHIIDRISPL